MEIYQGRAVYQGIAIGTVFFYEKGQQAIRAEKTGNPKREWERYEEAKRVAAGELEELYQKALLEVGEQEAEIFAVHEVMLRDEAFDESVKQLIEQAMASAEYAVSVTGGQFVKLFEAMDDEYLRARGADVKDVSDRLLEILSGTRRSIKMGDEPVIVVAKDLTPSETVQMDKKKLLGFVTELGSSTSHTAILARTMNIPALTGITADASWDGKMAVLDGNTGTLYLEPEESVLLTYRELKRQELQRREQMLSLKGKENVTKTGQRIELYANIAGIGDLPDVLENDAGGIGLFRSEFLYLGREDYPTEEEQFQVYKQAVETMAGKKVIIRTLDIGADKKVDYFQMEPEENPALGYRAIRICLERTEVFQTQLRALFRASAFGKLAIMYPMITSVEEVRKIKELSALVQSQLTKEGIATGDVEEGIMIETPAAAIISDLLAKEVDFFSIGTNDLTQYTLAVDRQNPKLEAYYNPHHEAVLRLIGMVVENAHKEGIWAGICGELGADTTLTKTFLEMGVDELSVSPAAILPIREIVRNTD